MFLFAACGFLISQAAEAKNLSPKEKEWQSCEGGYYTGPREGRRSYSNDQYLWVVTPAFAKRFCMPLHMVSEELKGAEAIAFRMVDGADNDRCGVDSKGETHCTENSTARFEIYLPQSLNLPAANPQVKFFEDARTTSDWKISNISERITKAQRYRKGEYKLPEGRTPHFANPYAHPDPGHRFGLIYAHDSKGQWPVSPLWEVGFRGDWIKGMDMVIFEAQTIGMGFSTYLNVEKVQSHGYAKWQPMIVMDLRKDHRNDDEKKVPNDYAHVIYLPKQFTELIRTATMKKGSNYLEFIKSVQPR